MNAGKRQMKSPRSNRSNNNGAVSPAPGPGQLESSGDLLLLSAPLKYQRFRSERRLPLKDGVIH